MSGIKFRALFIMLCVVVRIDSARILAVFPAPFISHQLTFRPIIRELVRRGHDLTLITPDPIHPKGEAPVNLKEIDLHEVLYAMKNRLLENTTMGSTYNFYSQMKMFIEAPILLFGRIWEDKEFQNVINDKESKFDLLLIEAGLRPFLALSHVLNVPVIQISSCGGTVGIYERMGAPSHPILYPMPLRTRLYNMTILEKVSEIYRHYWSYWYYRNNIEIENKELKKYFGDDFPSLIDLESNIEMTFLNIHHFFVNNRPVPPSVVYLGGIHLQAVKELPKSLQSYLDSSKNGVIYVSFGTSVRSEFIHPKKIRAMIKVLSELPYNVLWKWDQEELPGKSENIKISKWLPQADLLRHPNIKLFITQGGLQSTDEAIAAGVPLIGIPMFADQYYNVETYVKVGIGVLLYTDTITEEKFKETVANVIGEQRYRRNILKLRTWIQDQPQTSLERAIWWIEHLLRHGSGKHLRAEGENISWFQYLELELVFVLFTILLAVLVVFDCFVRICHKIVKKYSRKK